MLYNVGADNPGVLAWSGTTAIPRKIGGWNGFSFVFEVLAPLAADTIFNLQFAPVSDADPCLPGTFANFAEPNTCVEPTFEGQTRFVIEAGTPVGSICSFTPACAGGPFAQLVAVSGDTADVRGVLVWGGRQF